jgi:hypothetical protein
MTWPQAIAIAIIGGEALFQGGLLANLYIERHEMQEIIALANGIELTGEEGVWRAKAYPLCWDVLAHRRWPRRQEIDGQYNCRAEEAGGI